MHSTATITPISVTEVIQSANQYLHEKQYAVGRIYQHNRMWRYLLEYSARKCAVLFTAQLCMDFLLEEGHVQSIGSMSKYERDKYRSMRILIDIAQKKQPSARYVPVPTQMPIPFMDMSKGYQVDMEQRNQKARTVATKMSRIKVFFSYLDSRNIATISHLDFQIIMGFTLFLQEIYSPVAKSNILFTLRDFLSYAENCGMASPEFRDT